MFPNIWCHTVSVFFSVSAFNSVADICVFAGVDGNSEGLVVKFDEGKVIGISSCWNVSFCF